MGKWNFSLKQYVAKYFILQFTSVMKIIEDPVQIVVR